MPIPLVKKWAIAFSLAIGLAIGSVVGAHSAGSLFTKILAHIRIPGRPDDAGLASLKAEGQTIIDRIEQYKRQHGRYPNDLAEAGIHLPDAQYGGWQYDCSDGSSFALRIGDYSKDLFVLLWAGEWYLDS
jgi:hypothetical protein